MTEKKQSVECVCGRVMHPSSCLHVIFKKDDTQLRWPIHHLRLRVCVGLSVCVMAYLGQTPCSKDQITPRWVIVFLGKWHCQQTKGTSFLKDESPEQSDVALSGRWVALCFPNSSGRIVPAGDSSPHFPSDVTAVYGDGKLVIPLKGTFLATCRKQNWWQGKMD